MNGIEMKVALRRLGRSTIKSTGVAALLLGLVVVQPAIAATQTQKITAPDGESSDFFGYSVLMSQGDLFVGAQGRDSRNGAVYVYPAGGGYASAASIIEPPSGTRNYFGTRILRQGDSLFVSGQRSGEAATSAGAVYVYQKDASGAWNLSQTLTATAPGSNDWFGNALAIENDRLLIGAPRRDLDGVLDVGAVYAFTRDGSGQWSENAVIIPDTPTAQGEFGASVALKNGRALVGMPGYGQAFAKSGIAYAYSVDSGGVWTLAQTLEPTTPSERAGFGSSVAMAGEQAVIAAPNENSGGSVYALTQSEGSWAISQRLESAEGFQGLQFGFSVGLSPSGQHLAVGAPGAITPGFNSGEIHLFKAQGAGTFVSDGPVLETEDLATRDYLGSALSVTDEQVVVAGVRLDDDKGSSSGSVYLFESEETPSAPVAPLGFLLLGAGGLLALRRKAK